VRAVRTGSRQGLVAGQTIDDDVQEAAYGQSQHQCDCIEIVLQFATPSLERVRYLRISALFAKA